MFNIDCVYYGKSSASRILLTRRPSYMQFNPLYLTNLKVGDPILFNGKNLLFVNNHYRKDLYRDTGYHNVHFVFDAETISSKWLWKHCTWSAVNHSAANTKDKVNRNRFSKHQCFRFNTKLGQECPSPWSTKETEKKMLEMLDFRNDEKFISKHLIEKIGTLAI